MAKNIEDCQTPEELAEAISYHLKQGGMRREYYDQKGLRDIKYDEFETKRLYGIALNKYNEICKSYPNLPYLHISTSDSLSGLAQIQQLCSSEQESLQEIIEVLKNWQKSEKTGKDFVAAKSALLPIAKTYEILCRSKGRCGAKTTDFIRMLGSAANDGSGYYPALLENFSSPEVIADLEKWQEKPAEIEQGDKDTKKEREGMIEPKPPEKLQEILWLLKYGRRHWKLVSVAVFIFLCIWILPKINLFSKKHRNINSETKTDNKVEDITLLYLFENDFNNILRAGEDIILTYKNGSQITVKSKLYLDFESQTEFVGFYIPSVPETFDICTHLA